MRRGPPEKPGEEYGNTIFDEGETIHEHVQPEDFTLPNPDMVMLLTDSNNEESVSDKHTFKVAIIMKKLQKVPILISNDQICFS